MIFVRYIYDGTPMAGCFKDESAFKTFTKREAIRRNIKIKKESSRKMTESECNKCNICCLTE